MNKEISATDMMTKKNFTVDDAQKAILQIKKEFGSDMARRIEQMMRLETAHFTSGQYKLTGSAGMEVGKWSNIPDGATAGYANINDTHKISRDENGNEIDEKFIVWNSVTDFARYLANYIKRYDGNYARWNSTSPTAQTEYRKRVNSITPRFIA